MLWEAVLEAAPPPVPDALPVPAAGAVFCTCPAPVPVVAAATSVPDAVPGAAVFADELELAAFAEDELDEADWLALL